MLRAGGAVQAKVEKLVSKLRVDGSEAQRMVEGKAANDGLSAEGVKNV